MLYPNFAELVAFKGRKSHLIHPSFRAPKSFAPGNHHSPFRGQGLEFDSVRAYVPGDDIRSIDWRVTARTGSAHIKLFKEDRERHISLCVDMNATMRFGTRNTFKSIQAAKAAALLGWQALSKHDRVASFLFGDVPKGIQYFTPTKTGKTFCEMLKALSKPPAETNVVSFEKVLQHISKTAHTGSLVYVISDFMNVTPSLLEDASINRLCKSSDVIFIAINDAADKSLVPFGGAQFFADEKNKIYADTDSKGGRKLYMKQWEQNRKLMCELTARLKIRMIELTTESDVFFDLPLGLKLIAKRKKR